MKSHHKLCFQEICEPIASSTSAYEWQTFIRVRLDPAPTPRASVATVGKVRGAERYTILPALRFARDIGHGLTLDSMEAVRAHLRQAVKTSLS